MAEKGSRLSRALEAEAFRGSLEAGGFSLFLPFQHFAEPFGPVLGFDRRLDGPGGGLLRGAAALSLQGLHPLLDQHLRHVAHGAGFLFGQGSQTLTKIFRQDDLNTGRFGSPAGGGLKIGRAHV